MGINPWANNVEIPITKKRFPGWFFPSSNAQVFRSSGWVSWLGMVHDASPSTPPTQKKKGWMPWWCSPNTFWSPAMLDAMLKQHQGDLDICLGDWQSLQWTIHDWISSNWIHYIYLKGGSCRVLKKVGYSETWNLWRNYFIMHILQSIFRKLTPHFYSGKSLHELANYCSMMIDILVGGFNPSEKTWSNWILSPSRGEHFKNETTT